MARTTPTSGSASRISDLFAAARRRRFVGRTEQLALFQSALLADEPEFAVLYVHGPGGVGKTTLLKQFAGLAEEAGRAVVRIDARDLQPSPDDLLVALAHALGSGPCPPDELAARWPIDGVLMVDTYEAVSSLDGWLRGVLLRRLPARTLVVLGGRQSPALAWTTDIEWAPLTRIVALRNLDPDESRSYLSARGVAAARHASILSSAYGHPLALSLAADAMLGQEPGAEFDLGRQPNVVRALLHHLVDHVPSPQHRMALHACAAAPVLTEPMLASALALDDAHPLFEWLSGLACIESETQGLCPHELAREVLYADFRRCDPDLRRALNGRMLGHLYESFQRAEGARRRQQLWFDIMYVQRYNAGLRRYLSWSTAPTVLAEPLRGGDDGDAILAMTQRHEGAAAAAIAAHWLQRQPQAFLGFRDLRGHLVGYMANLRLDAATEEDRHIDPATDRALAFIHQRAPARSGEEIAYVRFWMGRDDYQANPATMNVLAANGSLYWTTQPRLAWSLCAVADADHFDELFSGIHMHRTRDADFELGPRTWGVFAHDWRAETVAQWLAMKVDRASQDEPTLAPVRGAAPLLVLSEADFAQVLRQALRDFGRSDALLANPLLRTRLVLQHGERQPPVENLRALIRQAANTLDTPKDSKSLAAILHTYLQPLATQEQAAECMGVPFNTYRYQLARGTQRIVQWLWAREVGQA